jgi:hypothetical protein
VTEIKETIDFIYILFSIFPKAKKVLFVTEIKETILLLQHFLHLD